jgi:hypothetical protein
MADIKRDMESVPPASNAYAPHTAGMLAEDEKGPERVVEMSEGDRKHMQEGLGVDPQQLYEKHEQQQERLQGRQQELQAAAPQGTLEDMASEQSTQEAAPRQPAEGAEVDPVADKMHEPSLRQQHVDKPQGTSKDTRGYS